MNVSDGRADLSRCIRCLHYQMDYILIFPLVISTMRPEQTNSAWKRLIVDSSGDVRRMTSAWRYGSIPIIVPESVSCHSYWVTLYSVMIHREVMKQSPPPIKRKYSKPNVLAAVLLKAVCHDMGEMMTGDIIRPFKHSTPKLKKVIDEAEGQMMEELAPKSILSIIHSVDDMAGDAMVYVNAVVKAADFMSLYQFMRREVLRGNCEIRDFVEHMEEDLSKLCAGRNPSWPFDVLALYYRELEKSAKKLHILVCEMRGEIK